MIQAIERKLIFMPSPAEDGVWRPHELDVEDTWFETDDGVRLHGWYCACPDDAPNSAGLSAQVRPVMVFFHGNAGNLSHRAPTLHAIQTRLGVDCFIFDYRGYGKSNGRPSEQGLYLDGRAAYRCLTETRGVGADRLVFFGRSLGGAVALELGLAVEHRALILESTFTSLPDVAAGLYPWLPVRRLMRTRFANAERIGRYRKPVLIAHGQADTLVPREHARKLHALANEPKVYLEVQGAGHNDVIDFGGDRYFDTFQRFLDLCFSQSQTCG